MYIALAYIPVGGLCGQGLFLVSCMWLLRTYIPVFRGQLAKQGREQDTASHKITTRWKANESQGARHTHVT